MPLNTLPASLSSIASALRLSPEPPAFDWITNTSPCAGAPVICTRVPLMSMLPPGVYANAPAPLMLYVVGLMNWIVAVASRFGFVTSITLPAEIAPLPVLPRSALVRVGAAAAMSPGRRDEDLQRSERLVERLDRN